jgi:hypothetical protein
MQCVKSCFARLQRVDVFELTLTPFTWENSPDHPTSLNVSWPFAPLPLLAQKKTIISVAGIPASDFVSVKSAAIISSITIKTITVATFGLAGSVHHLHLVSFFVVPCGFERFGTLGHVGDVSEIFALARRACFRHPDVALKTLRGPFFAQHGDSSVAPSSMSFLIEPSTVVTSKFGEALAVASFRLKRKSHWPNFLHPFFCIMKSFKRRLTLFGRLDGREFAITCFTCEHPPCEANAVDKRTEIWTVWR